MALLFRLGIYLIPLLQMVCMFHAYRSGRPYYWIWLILFFPPFGALAYFLLEIAPTMDWNRIIDENLGFLSFFARRRLAALADNVDFSPTVENRMAYAEELTRQGFYDHAIDEINGCLSGPLKDDAHILLTLARTFDLAERWKEVLETVHRFRPEDYRKSEHTLKHLCAVALDNLDDKKAAEALYRELLSNSSGEEVRCRLAYLLLESDPAEARSLLEETMTNARRGTSHYRTVNNDWIKFARYQLGQLKQ